MIERYSRPRMKRIWSDNNKFDKWLQVEIAACEAWSELGKIPAEDVKKIKKASYDLDRMEEILKVTHHDMTAFLNTVSESLGEESRFIHLGLTSSDIMDTALSLQLKEAAVVLAEDIAGLIASIEKRAIEHKKTMMIGRTHGVHAEPITVLARYQGLSEHMQPYRLKWKRFRVKFWDWLRPPYPTRLSRGTVMPSSLPRSL
jgi:adenylosuccinate lyase